MTRPMQPMYVLGYATVGCANKRHQFDLVTSQLVLDEADSGNPIAAAARLELLAWLSLIDINSDVVSLARRLVEARMRASGSRFA